MTNRRKLSVAQLFALICGLCLSFSSGIAQAAKLDAYLIIKWEGKALEEPNLEALDSFRKKFPDVPVIHLINPAYFKETAKVSGDNFEAIKKRIADNDEVGLYLVPSANLVKAADVMLLKKPTFWNYSEELCTNDCGLSVPMTAYTRADVVKLTYTAHSILKEFGFSDLQSFAVHGFVHPAGILSITEGLGYTNDLTGIDKSLLRNYLKEYPVGQWIESAEKPVATGAVSAWTQAGGVIEFNNDAEIVKRFKSFYADNKDKTRAFIISVSVENLFMSSSRLENTIQGLRDQATASGDQLSFEVMTNGKKGRPVARNKVINGKSNPQ